MFVQMKWAEWKKCWKIKEKMFPFAVSKSRANTQLNHELSSLLEVLSRWQRQASIPGALKRATYHRRSQGVELRNVNIMLWGRFHDIRLVLISIRCLRLHAWLHALHVRTSLLISCGNFFVEVFLSSQKIHLMWLSSRCELYNSNNDDSGLERSQHANLFHCHSSWTV